MENYPILLTILISIFTSLIASYLYFKFSYTLKPKLLISKEISKSVDSEGDIKYSFKVVNGSRRSAMNLKAELFKVKHLPVLAKNENKNYFVSESTKVELVKDSLMELKGINSMEKYAPYEFRFHTKMDISKFLLDNENKDPFIKIKIFATDSQTGFGKVFEQEYTSINSIIKGRFRANESMEISESNDS